MNYLKDLGFDQNAINIINESLPKKALETLETKKEIVIKNVKYMKELGISNYQVAFVKFYNMFLMDNEEFDEIFSKYDVKLVISTTELKIDGVNCILLENIISSNSNKRFEKILLEFLDKNDIKVIKKDIVKMFSLKNIINQLNILDPNKIINEVDIIISKMENGLKTAFPLDLRMLLYIHISIMIERLILNQELVFEEDDSDYIKENKEVIKIINDSFESISKEYNLNLTSKEIKLIQEIIESRLGKLKK